MPSIVRRLTLLAIAGAACAPALGGHTNNILITGYWPPTNEMIRSWSTNPAQNPGGWIGGNWEGRGYDIHSYFPEFPGGTGSNPQGNGDFEVDYQDTSADWERIVNEINPVAIITFSRANTSNGWELEGGNRMYESSQWTSDYTTPFRPGNDLPIMQALTPGTELFSTLPIGDIIANVGASGANVNPFETAIDNGRFLSNYIGLHGNWYHEMNNGPDAEFRNFAAGHIHVGQGISTADGVLATEATLRTLTDYLDTVVPTPATFAPLVLGGIFASRRRR